MTPDPQYPGVYATVPTYVCMYIGVYIRMYVYRGVHNGFIQTIPQCETEMHLFHMGSILYAINILLEWYSS